MHVPVFNLVTAISDYVPPLPEVEECFLRNSQVVVPERQLVQEVILMFQGIDAQHVQHVVSSSGRHQFKLQHSV